MTVRRNSALLRLLPDGVKSLIKRSKLYVKYRTTSVNVYHCCVQKTGSQWIKAILSDSRTYRYSGLSTYTYQDTLPGGHDPRRLTDRTFTEPFPPSTIVTPLYIDYESFVSIPKPDNYKAFFVMRDPRDLVVSKYFGRRYSHFPMGNIPESRQLLTSMSLSDGMVHIVKYMQHRGHYAALRSWVDLSQGDDNVLLLRFEDLTGPDSCEALKGLLSHCDIRVPDGVIHQLVEDYSFERLSGRKPGEEDRSAHYRKGVHGDWRNFFDDMITANFKAITGDLVLRLGYEDGLDW